MLVPGSRWHTVVSNEGLSEDKDLATVGGIGHRFRIANQAGSEHGLPRCVGPRAERCPVEDGAVLALRVSEDSLYESIARTHLNGKCGTLRSQWSRPWSLDVCLTNGVLNSGEEARLCTSTGGRGEANAGLGEELEHGVSKYCVVFACIGLW
jgi:hypothetical protein